MCCHGSGAQNQECLPAFSSGPLGPEYAKFDFAAVYGRAWVCRANAPGAYSDGRPKGLPYPIPEGFLENRRGGAEGESAEGREKPPWGVPLPQAGLGPAPTKEGTTSLQAAGAGVLTRPPGFRQGPHKAVGATLAVARAGYGIRFRTPLQGRLAGPPAVFRRCGGTLPIIILKQPNSNPKEMSVEYYGKH